MSFHNFIFRVRERLGKYSDLLPLFCVIGNILWTLFIFSHRYYLEELQGIKIDPNETHPLATYDYIVRGFTEVQLAAIILMFCKSKNYRFISWFSLSLLSLWWVINLVYVIMKFEVDIYYTVCFWVIFPIIAALATWKLTNRC